MVICKFYRQGNCRYGQYCQFEHVNHFGNTKVDCNEDDIPVMVAKEVLLAERGGQWLLSCFAPLKDRPSIPGMLDLSPEEVRWEVYQAQKNGMVEQAKLYFQQLCQDMKTKRDALKNPNRETIALLKKLLGTGQKGGFNGSGNIIGKSSNFSFAAPQLGLTNNASVNNVFGKQTFCMQSNNPFGRGFNAPNDTSIFGRTLGNTSNFANNLGFGTATSSIFCGTTNTSTFNNVQNTSTFGASQTNSIFGASSQGVFSQNNVFGGTNQLTSPSITSTFDNGATSSTSLFNNTMTSQANTSLFGGVQTPGTNLFGGASNTQMNSIFGTTTSSGPFNTGIFSQPKTLPAFGGAPVFGGVINYTNNSGSIFGVPAQTFGASAISNSSIFGAATLPAFGTSTITTTSAFSLTQQSVANTFKTTMSTPPNVFGTQATGTTMSAGNSTSFGTPAVTISNLFATASSQFNSTNTISTPFAGVGFGPIVASTSNTFDNTVTSSNPLFANTGTTFASSNTTVSNPSLFSVPTYGNLNASPFGTTAVTTTTMTTNPFALRTQQNSMPFGSIAQNQSTGIVSTSSLFRKSPFTTAISSTLIDDNIYSVEGLLTDDEKSIYLAEKFIIGKIPLKPPTKDIR